MMIYPQNVEKIINIFNSVSEEFFKETKTMFSLSKPVDGHIITFHGPKSSYCHWGVSGIKFPQRSLVTLQWAKLKIDGVHICTIKSEISINQISDYDMKMTKPVRFCHIRVRKPFKILDERDKSILMLKLIFPDLFKKEEPSW